MKIFISIFLIFSLDSLAHEVPPEMLKQLKQVADKARVELRQASSRYQVMCHSSDGKRNNKIETTALNEWYRACEQSKDSKIVLAKEKLHDIRKQIEDLKQSSSEYKKWQEASQALNKRAGTIADPVVRALYDASQLAYEQWSLVSKSLDDQRLQEWSNFYGSVCKENDDPVVTKAFEQYQNVRSACSKASENFNKAVKENDSALRAYNEAVGINIHEFDDNNSISRDRVYNTHEHKSSPGSVQ